MSKLSGSCLCGAVSYHGDAEIKMALNCHCTDCRKVTGAVFGTLLFVPETALTITGDPATYQHDAESGSTLSKLFCSDCGSQVFAQNSSRPGIIAIRAGGLDQPDLIQPTANLFCDSAVASTPMDAALKDHARMPKG